MSDEREEYGANGVALEAEPAQAAGDSVASALEAAAAEAAEESHATDALVMESSSRAPQRDHFGRPLAGYSLESLQGVDPFPSVESIAAAEDSALRDDASVPPVDLDGGFFDGPEAESTLDLEPPDPRLLQKMTSAAALRRAHLRKYVTGSVTVATALCLAALIKGAMTPRGPETVAAADGVVTVVTAPNVAAAQPTAVTLSPLPSATEVVAPAAPQAVAAAAAAAVEAPSPPAQPSAEAPAGTGTASPDHPSVAAPVAASVGGQVAPAAPVAVANVASAAAPPVALPAAPSPPSAAPAAVALSGDQQPAGAAVAINHPSAGGDSAKTAVPAAASPAPTAAAAAAVDAVADPHLAAREKTRSQGALESGRLAEAVAAGEHSVSLDPSDAETWLILGGAYQARGDQKNAQRCFRACVGQASRGPKGECAALAQSK